MNLVELLQTLPGDQVASLLAKTLSYREREIVKLLTGIGDGFTYTREEVAHIFKQTVPEIAKAETRAFERLSAALGVDESGSHSEIGTLDVFIDPGTASPEQVAELLTAISTLYRLLGGSGISFTMANAKEPAVA